MTNNKTKYWSTLYLSTLLANCCSSWKKPITFLNQYLEDSLKIGCFSMYLFVLFEAILCKFFHKQNFLFLAKCVIIGGVIEVTTRWGQLNPTESVSQSALGLISFLLQAALGNHRRRQRRNTMSPVDAEEISVCKEAAFPSVYFGMWHFTLE